METETGRKELFEDKFNYLLFGVLGTLLIITLYFVGGIFLEGFLSYIFPGLQAGLQSSIIQILLMLVPAVIAIGITPAGFGRLLNIGLGVNLKISAIAILGYLPLIIFYTSYSYLQDVYIAPYFEPYYTNIKDFITDAYSNIFRYSGPYGIIPAVFVAAIVPAISEELLFRGYFQGCLLQKLKPRNAILIASVVFAITHLNPISLLPLLMIGLYLGLSAYLTKNIIVPIVIHFINNFISVLVFYSPELESIDKAPEQIPLIYLILSMALSAAIIAIAIKYMITIRSGKKQKEGAGSDQPLM